MDKRIVLIVLGLVLIAGAVIAMVGAVLPAQPRRFHSPVASLLPVVREGWAMQVQPIADTPEMKAKVNELLNYDDAIFAVFTKGAQRLSVYIAYWTPGKARYRDIAGHTPDTCWVGAGWECSLASLLPDYQSARGQRLCNAQHRIMLKDGVTEHVLFWHLVGGEAEYFRTGWPPKWYEALTDLPRMGRRMRAEQFFIRISSNEPIERWPEMSVYRELLANLAPLFAGQTG